MDTDTVVAVTQLVNRYGHVADGGDLDRLAAVFTTDAVFDQRNVGGVLQDGLEAIRAFFALPVGDKRPHKGLAHHATNVYVYEADGEVRSICKFLVVDVSSNIHTGVYEDIVRREGEEWKIARRVVRLMKPDA